MDLVSTVLLLAHPLIDAIQLTLVDVADTVLLLDTLVEVTANEPLELLVDTARHVFGVF